MAATAFNSRVLAIELVAGQTVIESHNVKFYESEIHPVMLGVAPDAILARTELHVVGGVQSFSTDHPLVDFRVARQTLVSRFSG
jgi:hypothetical protein